MDLNNKYHSEAIEGYSEIDLKLLVYDQVRYKTLLNDIYEEIQNLNIVFLKGEVLSYMAYGNFGLRRSSDIDLLIPRRNIKKAEELLLKKGYTNHIAAEEERLMRVFCLSSSHQLMSFHKKKRGADIDIDVNFDILWGEYEGKRIEIDEFISDSMRMDLFGYEVKVLRPDKALIQLALHHYKEMNSIFLLVTRNPINCKMFKDVYFLWKNNCKYIELKHFFEECKRYEIVPYIFYILYYTNLIYNDDNLQKFVYKFESEEGLDLLNSYGLSRKERREWKTDFSTRLEKKSLFDEIKSDLTVEDKKKIEINKKIFL